MSENNYDFCILITTFNRGEMLKDLLNQINNEKRDYKIKIIVIDDGSTDTSWNIIEELALKDKNIKAIKFQKNYGKSAAFQKGFELATGQVVITMDADLQDSPEEIPELYRMIVEDNFDLVSGWKKNRHDPLSKTLPTKLYNWAARIITGIHLHDFNCGLKAYKNEVVKSIEVYGEMHRYIPVLAKWAGFTQIAEQVVEHRARKYGTTKFGFSRFVNGFLDLLSIFFVGKFAKRPMHFFGTMGMLSFLGGLAITIWLIVDKLTDISKGLAYRNVTDQPLFYIALVAIIVGFQLFLTGFIAELVSRNAPERNHYHIGDKV